MKSALTLRASLLAGVALATGLVLAGRFELAEAAPPPLPCAGPLVDTIVAGGAARLGGPSCSSYTIMGPLTVAPGATLSIDPGVKLQFTVDLKNNDGSLDIAGTLQAPGTAAKPITFTTLDNNPQPPAASDACAPVALTTTWRGIEVAGGGRATISQATISWAQNGLLADPGSNVSSQSVTYTNDFCTGVRLKLGSTSQARLTGDKFISDNIGMAVTTNSGGPVVRPTNENFHFNQYGLLVGGVAEVDVSGSTFADNVKGAFVADKPGGLGVQFAAPVKQADAEPVQMPVQLATPTAATLKVDRTHFDRNQMGIQAGVAPDIFGTVMVTNSSFTTAGCCTYMGILVAGRGTGTVNNSNFGYLDRALQAQNNAQLTLTGSQVTGSSTVAVHVIDAATATVQRSQITGGQWGIILHGTATGTVDKTQIRGLIMVGLYADTAAEVTVTNTQISDLAYGVYLQDAATGKFSGLNVSEAWAGLTSKSKTAVTIDKSAFRLNDYGVIHDASPLTIHASNVSDNWTGVTVTTIDPNYPSQLNADGLILDRNEYGMVVVASMTASQVTVQNSNIVGNYVAGLWSDNADNGSPAPVDAMNDWWGDAGGPKLSVAGNVICAGSQGSGDLITGASAGDVNCQPYATHAQAIPMMAAQAASAAGAMRRTMPSSPDGAPQAPDPSRIPQPPAFPN